MQLDQALQHLKACRERMDSLYGRTVFDEWVLISLVAGKSAVLHYEGARADSLTAQIKKDAAQLSETMEGRQYEVGDFEFAQDATGSAFDAVVRLGNNTFLLCNNTTSSMAELRAAPAWREAQKPFVSLTHKFFASPLEL